MGAFFPDFITNFWSRQIQKLNLLDILSVLQAQYKSGNGIFLIFIWCKSYVVNTIHYALHQGGREGAKDGSKLSWCWPKKMEIPMEWLEGWSSQSDHITAKIHTENTKIAKKTLEIFSFFKKRFIWFCSYISPKNHSFPILAIFNTFHCI